MFTIKYFRDSTSYTAYEADTYHRRDLDGKAIISGNRRRDNEISSADPTTPDFIIEVGASEVAYIENSAGKTIDTVRPYSWEATEE